MCGNKYIFLAAVNSPRNTPSLPGFPLTVPRLSSTEVERLLLDQPPSPTDELQSEEVEVVCNLVVEDEEERMAMEDLVQWIDAPGRDFLFSQEKTPAVGLLDSENPQHPLFREKVPRGRLQ